MTALSVHLIERSEANVMRLPEPHAHAIPLVSSEMPAVAVPQGAVAIAVGADVKLMRGPDFTAHPLSLIAISKEAATLEAVGPRGPQGIQGNPGPTSPPIKGDKGDAGSPGVKGDPGPPVDTSSLTLDGGFF